MKRSKIPANPKVLLYGYGLEGKSSEAWIKQEYPGATISRYHDADEQTPDWANFDLIIKSPGVPPRQIPPEFQTKVTSNFRLFMENLSEPERQKVIGITGSKGKSTTAKFTHELLQHAGFKTTVIGNFGVPALDHWYDRADFDFIVAECSSFQLNDLQVSPHFALFLSFFPDHLEWHNASYEEYLAAKTNLWRHQSKEDFLFLTKNTATILVPPELGGAGRSPEGVHTSEAVASEWFPPQSTLQAPHFRENLGTVFALAQLLEIVDLPSVWAQTAADFEMIEHRLELVATINGTRFYNDSIATSPDAVEAAVKFFGAELGVLIMDGADTGLGGFDLLAELIRHQAPKAQVIALESDISRAFLLSAKRAEIESRVFLVADLESALVLASSKLQNGQACVFSPGGKSFNRYANYAERGRHFKDLVKAIA